MNKTQIAHPRICLVGPMTGQNLGSLPTQGDFLASQLSQEGHPVRIVSSRKNRYLRLLDIFWTLLRQRNEIDTLIIQTYSGNSFINSDIASLIGKWTSKQIIFQLHGGNLPNFSRKHSHWVRRVLDRSSRIISPSKYLARELAWLGYHIQVIPNVIDLAAYPFQLRTEIKPRLLWMRSFEEIYNPQMAVQVLARLLSVIPDATLTMAGPDRGLLLATQHLAMDLGVSDRVHFPGFLDLQGKLQAGNAHDIYLNTNRIDNMPISVLEMGAMGLPIVATSVGGIPDLLTDGHNGLLVPSEDAQGMMNAIVRLIQTPSLGETLSRNGRKLAELSTWEHVRGQWEQILQKRSL